MLGVDLHTFANITAAHRAIPVPQFGPPSAEPCALFSGMTYVQVMHRFRSHIKRMKLPWRVRRENSWVSLARSTEFVCMIICERFANFAS